MAFTKEEPDLGAAYEPEQIEANINGIDVRLYSDSNGLWCAQIGNGYYHWLCTKTACIDAAEKRVKEIISDKVTFGFKYHFRK